LAYFSPLVAMPFAIVIFTKILHLGRLWLPTKQFCNDRWRYVSRCRYCGLHPNRCRDIPESTARGMPV